MKIKILLTFLTLGLLGASSTLAAMASPLPCNKLSFGFQPDLVAGRDFAVGQLIVGIQPDNDVEPLIQAASQLGGRLTQQISGSAILLEFSTEEAVNAAINVLAVRDDVKYVERNGLMRISPIVPSLDLQRLRGIKRNPESRKLMNDY